MVTLNKPESGPETRSTSLRFWMGVAAIAIVMGVLQSKGLLK